ncbi:MAG TPA: DNA polymerase I [Patescibacteria group bacterium]|nr:DNA polymerase I [Patescibacteria group bacterium]
MSNLSETTTSPLFLILDGNALLHRAWHALPPLSTHDGRVVNAVYGFTMVLEKLLESRHPSHMAVAWDLPGKTFRHEASPEYKAQRVKQSQEFYDQIPLAKQIVHLYGIQNASAEGFEADDVIGTIARQASGNGMDVLIVTGDLDALQLVDPRVRVLFFQKGLSETKLYDEAAVEERFGFGPERLVDYKALRGDPSDNVPGVPGVGEKTATELIQKFKTVESLFEALERGEVSPKAAKKMQGKKELALKSRLLVRIVNDVPLPLSEEGYRRTAPEKESLVRLFQELAFKTLLKKYSSPSEKTVENIEKKNETKKTVTTTNLQELRQHLQAFSGAKILGFALGEKGVDLFGNRLAFVSVSSGDLTVVVPDPTAEPIEEILAALSAAGSVAAHDVKRIFHLLAATAPASLPLTERIRWKDIRIAGYLLEAGGRDHDLPHILQSEIGDTKMVRGVEIEDPVASAACLPALQKHLEKRLKVDGLWHLYEETEMPLISILFHMEHAGIRLDTDLLKNLSKTFEKTLERLTKKIHKIAGSPFNVNSPSQIAHVLFDVLALSTKGVKKTKEGLSTAASELEKLAEIHPVVPLIQEHREIAKLASTYVDVLPTLVTSDGRIHTTFQQAVTTTGRLSSSDPNLQNIPIKTTLGQSIRRAFIPEKGKQFLACDYSQIELRLMAAIAKDQPFLQAFRDGADIHRRTAAELWDTKEETVTPEQRRAAKAINFGILYGMGPRSLARSTGLSFEEAQLFIDRFFEIHHAVHVYLDETKIQAQQLGYVETLFGRRRHLPEIHSGVPALRAATERMALNMPIQGTEADLIKMTMVQIDGWIRTVCRKKGAEDRVHLLLQVHDELLFEVEKSFVYEAAQGIKHIMETVVTLDVPLLVDVEVGPSWGDLEKLRL